MNRSQTAQVLTKIAAFDRRTIGESDVLAWHDVLEPMPFDDCMLAVTAHFTETNDWCMPSNIVSRVKAIRRERLKKAGDIRPNGTGGEPDVYVAELRAVTAEVASGRMTPRELCDYEDSGLNLVDWQADKPRRALIQRDMAVIRPMSREIPEAWGSPRQVEVPLS